MKKQHTAAGLQSTEHEAAIQRLRDEIDQYKEADKSSRGELSSLEGQLQAERLEKTQLQKQSQVQEEEVNRLKQEIAQVTISTA